MSGPPATFRDLIAGDELIVAPVALNPIMARLAADAGFKALYMSGGSLGWLKCVTEANVTLCRFRPIADSHSGALRTAFR